MAVVLDTSFLIDLSRGNSAAGRLFEELVERQELFIIPTVVVAEYLAGSRDPEHDMARLNEAAEILPFSQEDALAAASIARQSLANGSFPGWMDCLLAGVARNRGNIPVVTANPRHFPGSETLSY